MGITSIEEFLEHYGVKGMHWGIRKDRGERGGGSGGSGGHKPAHELSDEELQKHIKRMELEKRYTDLKSGAKAASKAEGKKFAVELGKNAVRTAVGGATGYAVQLALKKAFPG